MKSTLVSMEDQGMKEVKRGDHLGLAVVVMGVSGAGKTTIGRRLAEHLRCSFFDADDFHSEENKRKMRGAVPLSDEDRRPWLEVLRDLLLERVFSGAMVVLACSALKRQYRDFLRAAHPVSVVNHRAHASSDNGKPSAQTVIFLYLEGSYKLFMSRLEARFKEGFHYMPPSLLCSQIDALELDHEESGIIHVDASLPPEVIVTNVAPKVLDALARLTNSSQR